MESPPPEPPSSSNQDVERVSPELDLSIAFSGLGLDSDEANTSETKDWTEDERLYHEVMDSLSQDSSKELGHGVLTGHDFHCLAPGRCLNDEIVNEFLKLLQQRDASNRQHLNSIECHFFSTFLLPKLVTKYKYSEVRRWTDPKKLKRWGQMSSTVLNCDLIFFPRHHQSHWSLILVDLRSNVVSLYDSLCNAKISDESMKSVRVEMGSIVRYLVDEAREKIGEDWSEANFRFKIGRMPQQGNTWDCGVFLIQSIRLLSVERSLDFTQEDMDSLRVQIFNELMEGRLLER